MCAPTVEGAGAAEPLAQLSGNILTGTFSSDAFVSVEGAAAAFFSGKGAAERFCGAGGFSGRSCPLEIPAIPNTINTRTDATKGNAFADSDMISISANSHPYGLVR